MEPAAPPGPGTVPGPLLPAPSRRGLEYEEPFMTLSGPDIARRFGRHPSWWSRHRDHYIATRGFPAPLSPRHRAHLRWDRAAVEAWFTKEYPDHE